MNLAEVAANAAGTVVCGYLAGAAAGPAISGSAAAIAGVKSGSRAGMLKTSVGIAVISLAQTAALATTALTLGATALRLAPPLIQLPLLISMVALIAPLLPMTALLTGTFFSPAIPFQDEREEEEYQEMQDSYRSDQWQPPKLWPGRAEREADQRDPEGTE